MPLEEKLIKKGYFIFFKKGYWTVATDQYRYNEKIDKKLSELRI